MKRPAAQVEIAHGDVHAAGVGQVLFEAETSLRSMLSKILGNARRLPVSTHE